MAAAVAAALREGGDYVVVTGRSWSGLEDVVRAAALHVPSPGPSTRLAVARGIALGGRRAVVVVDEGTALDAPLPAPAITTSRQAALVALRAGWSVVQPAAATDVAPLLEQVAGPILVLVGSATGDLPADQLVPAPAPVRQWREGPLATLAASGRGIAATLYLGDRLLARGVEVNLVELAVLTRAEHGALVGGDVVLVGLPDDADRLRQDRPPARPMFAAALDQPDADLIGDVLAHVRVAP